MLVKAIAKESEAELMQLNISDLASKWAGEPVIVIRSLFQAARKSTKSVIILIKEIDEISTGDLNGSGESQRRTKTELLVQLQQLPVNITLACTSNAPWNIDAATRRRLERRIMIPLPTFERRIQMLRMFVSDTDHQLNYQDMLQITQETKGYSAYDIENLVKDARMKVLRRHLKAQWFKKTPDDFLEMTYPCDPDKSGQTLFTLDDPSKIRISPEVTRLDFLKALSKVSKLAMCYDQKQYEQFQSDFGSDDY